MGPRGEGMLRLVGWLLMLSGAILALAGMSLQPNVPRLSIPFVVCGALVALTGINALYWASRKPGRF